ncbi:unnamed protein product [Linum trigynum]|uniref:Uncharacterized protein n=1 Tax=Linum trigynum TaxID=586398 RepID=A0AAV2DZH3_9ROSI
MLRHCNLSIRQSPLELGAIVACRSLHPLPVVLSVRRLRSLRSSPVNLSAPCLSISLPSSSNLGNRCRLNLSVSVTHRRLRRQLAVIFLERKEEMKTLFSLRVEEHVQGGFFGENEEGRKRRKVEKGKN